MSEDDRAPPSCCDTAAACVFAKALLARAAECELVRRRALAEREVLECTSPAARSACARFASETRQRARFALRLPAAGQPLMHAQALRLQCGGLQGLQQALSAPRADVHRMLTQANASDAHELPWESIVRGIAHWHVRRRRPVGAR